MDIKEFFLENYGMLFELIGLLIMLRVSVHVSKTMKRQTCLVVVLLLVETLLFWLERWTQTFDHLSLLRPMLTASVYSIYPIILICLTQVTTTHKLTKKRLIMMLIPEIICVPIFFTSQWTHIVVWFGEGNNYHGGLVSRLPYILFGFYVVLFTVHNYFYFKNYSRQNRRVAIYIVAGPVIGTLLYLFGESGKDYSTLFASAILMYFIFLYIHMARIDPLTELLNRQCYYQEIDSNSKAITGVLSVDMNDLKYLNDNMGHEAGDEALQTVSAVMRDHCGRGGIVYRVGGDEFMILYSGTSEAEIAEAVRIMQEKMAETPYICAFGCAMKRPGEKIADVVRRSDKAMYEHKAMLKQKYGNKNAYDDRLQ